MGMKSSFILWPTHRRKAVMRRRLRKIRRAGSSNG